MTMSKASAIFMTYIFQACLNFITTISMIFPMSLYVCNEVKVQGVCFSAITAT